jgi:nucleotide-binding universal stress UspA family protein
VPSPEVRVETVLLEGEPASQILDRVHHLPADLLVLGTHGRSGFERWALGSVAEKVLRRALCPVLTVPRRMGHAPGDSRAVFQRILCPVDFSEASMLALEYAFSLAREADGRITLFHCLETLSEEEVPELLHFDITRFHQHLEETALQKLSTLVPAGAQDWCEPETLVTSGKAYREILRVSEERESDLIVMGIHGRRPFDLTLFGSTAQQVVRRAACPVLTLGARRRVAARVPLPPAAAL